MCHKWWTFKLNFTCAFFIFVVVINLRLRAKKGRWDVAGATRITQVNNNNIFTDYHTITKANCITAQINQTNNRAIQNARAMYQCLQNSITGNIKSTIFSQVGNLPDHEDGIALFKSITICTSVSSLQLSLQIRNTNN